MRFAGVLLLAAFIIFQLLGGFAAQGEGICLESIDGNFPSANHALQLSSTRSCGLNEKWLLQPSPQLYPQYYIRYVSTGGYLMAQMDGAVTLLEIVFQEWLDSENFVWIETETFGDGDSFFSYYSKKFGDILSVDSEGVRMTSSGSWVDERFTKK